MSTKLVKINVLGKTKDSRREVDNREDLPLEEDTSELKSIKETLDTHPTEFRRYLSSGGSAEEIQKIINMM